VQTKNNNKKMKRFTLQWNGSKPLVQFLMVICIFMIFAMIAGIFFIIVPIQNILLQQAVSSVIMFALSAIVWGKIFENKALGFMSVKKCSYTYYIFFAFALTVISAPFVAGLNIWNESWHLPNEQVLKAIQAVSERIMQGLLSNTTTGGFIANLLVLALLPAIVEEMFFRGAMQKTLIALCKNTFAGVIITSILFSLIHMEIYAFVPRVILGVILGYLYVWTGNIFVNMTYHFFNNAVVVVASYLFYSHRIPVNLNDNHVLFTPLLFALSLLCVALFFFVEIRKQKGIKPRYRLELPKKIKSKIKK